MARVIEAHRVGGELSALVQKAQGMGEAVADQVYRAAILQLFTKIIERTPVDTGRLRGNWQITTGQPSQRRTNSTARTKGRAYVQSKIPKNPLKRRIFLTNNLPYAAVVEYGEYPNPVKRGTLNPRTGEYEIRSAGGFSKQAPRGMVRISVLEFRRYLKAAARAI